jgi:hypothetical protein
LEKRRKSNLPIRVADSSDLSQSDIVEVDLTGKKPIVLEGEEPLRDMPVAVRKKRLVRVVHSPLVQEEHNDSAEMGDKEDASDRNDWNSQEEQDDGLGGESEQGLEENVPTESQITIAPLSTKLQVIVKDLYDSITSPNFNRTIVQMPTVVLDEFTFVPLSMSQSESLHMASLKEKALLAEKTRASANNSYSLRCFNAYLARRALIDKLKEIDPAKSESQIVYYLKERLVDFDLCDLNWENFKTCSYRGKAFADFMNGLNLGTYCKSILTNCYITLIIM